MSDQVLAPAETAGVRPRGSGAARRGVAGRVLRRVLFLCPLLALTTAGSCNNAETLFQSNFDPTEVGFTPAPAQAVGTAQVDGPVGSVVVVTQPPDAPAGKWVRLSRADASSPRTALQCKLSQARGNGTYVFSTTMFIPSGSGVVSIQFERHTQAASDYTAFMHVDFLTDNRVRIDDDASSAFGTFPRDKLFIVQVTLNINDTTPSARIALGGDGASGEATRDVAPPFRLMAREFGAVRLWMGSNSVGSFQATNIIVKRNQ